MKHLHDFKKQLLQDHEIKREYNELALEYAVIRQIINKRISMGLTQKKLAEKVGTKQSAISRLESGRYNPSLTFLQKVAHALDSELRVNFQ